MQSNNKQFILMLSATSFMASLLLSLLAYSLLVNQAPVNIISDRLAGIQLCATASLIHCFMSLVLFYIYSPNRFDTKIRLINIVSCCGLLMVACLFFHLVIVCFGAPVLQSVTETFYFAVLMTVLVCLPFCLLCGPSLDRWSEIFMEESPPLGVETLVYFTSLGSIIGAWLGAIPIPLDWDRPWQEWPITCVIGAVGGYAGGLMLTAVQLLRKYRAVHKSKFF